MQSLALRAFHKRKPQETQAIAFEWKPGFTLPLPPSHRSESPAAPLHATTWASCSHACASGSPSSTIWYRPNGGDALWLGRSDVVLTMCHSHSGIPTYRLSGQGKGDEHSAYVRSTAVRTFTFTPTRLQ